MDRNRSRLKRKNLTMYDLPNLYSFATKELAQDATLAYILAWAKPAYREFHPRLHRLGTDMLRALLATRNGETNLPTVTSLDVKTQVDRIDVLALINLEDEDGLVLLVEDKVGIHEHSNQIERYIETAEKKYPDRKIVPVYMKTMNASRWDLPTKEKCGRFLRRDLLDVLGQFPDTGDTIVDNFRAHLQVWENETISYRSEPFSKWGNKRRPIEGFYTELENRMAKEDKWKEPHWGHASNPAGGVRWFAFASNADTVAQKPYEVTMYLQIEDATRLTVRLCEECGPGVRKELMYEVLELLEGNVGKADEVRIKKAGRFGGGATAAVAEITFGDENGYIVLKDGGIVDTDATMHRLDRVRAFVAEVASHDRAMP